jgi:4a-hydroxytetrahydrobiopterin dehydratase
MTDVSDLAQKPCVRGAAGAVPLTAARSAALAAQVDAWQIVDGHHLSRRFTFPDFAGALDFVNRIGAVAEAEDHHPELYLGWGKVRVQIWTHACDGLTENDFILAAKIDGLA